MRIDPVTTADGGLGAVIRVLRAADLPTADIRSGSASFYRGRDDGRLVAVGGLEDCGRVCLLRSLAVPAIERDAGYGTAMVIELLDRASDRFDACYLLTTTATGFFERQGFEVIARAALPDSVRDTGQFGALCPTSATAMRRSHP